MRIEPSDADRGVQQAPPGCLFIVATPIGNLADITLRALDVLRRVDVIACEDTRVTAKLLSAYKIAARTVPYHDRNAARARPRLIQRLQSGESVALVSDAGTPLLSDPGFKLVRAAIAAGVPVSSLPGPTAAVAALTVSGLPTGRFLFTGFLPPGAVKRRKVLQELAGVRATLIFYESPRRLGASLGDMLSVLGDRPAAVARELTKLYEEIRRQPLSRLAAHYARAGTPKGEVVVVVGPPEPEDGRVDDAALTGLLRAALQRTSMRDAVDEITALTGRRRREVYERALALKDQRHGRR